MATVGEILALLNEKIPPALSEDWDNSGHLLGCLGDEATGVLLALDVTNNVVNEAKTLGCSLIVCHHPVIFHGMKAVTSESADTKVVYEILRSGLNVIALHTQLDSVAGGVNDILVKKLGISKAQVLCETDAYPGAGIGRMAYLDTPVSVETFAQSIKNMLNAPFIQYKSSGKTVRKIAVVSGSGDDYIDVAIAKGCDTFVTGELKYHSLTAEYPMNLICAGHFFTEVAGLEFVQAILKNHFIDLKVVHSKEQYQIISYR